MSLFNKTYQVKTQGYDTFLLIFGPFNGHLKHGIELKTRQPLSPGTFSLYPTKPLP